MGKNLIKGTTVRIPKELKELYQEKAKLSNRTLNEVIIEALWFCADNKS